MKRFRAWIIVAVVARALTAGADESKPTEGIDGQWLQTVVSIELMRPDGTGQPIGTGFLVNYPSNITFLITARHVVTGSDAGTNTLANLAFRLNQSTGTSRLYPDTFGREIASDWYLSETADVAARVFAFPSQGPDLRTISAEHILTQGLVRAGAPILAAGFPMGLRSEEHADPIVRRGIVARCDSAGITADVFTFPGNSGGPVFYVPTIRFSGNGITVPFHNREALIGLVSRQISYIEQAISPQTGRSRVTFEDNAGLTQIVSSDAIVRLLERADVKARISGILGNK